MATVSGHMSWQHSQKYFSQLHWIHPVVIFTSWSWTCHAFMQHHTWAVSLPQVIYSSAKRKDHRGRQEGALPIRLVSLVLEDISRPYESPGMHFWCYRESLSLPLTCMQEAGSGLLQCPGTHRRLYFPFVQSQHLPAGFHCTCSAHLIIHGHCWHSTSYLRLEPLPHIFSMPSIHSSFCSISIFFQLYPPEFFSKWLILLWMSEV